MRGEHDVLYVRGFTLNGSSPHARGARPRMRRSRQQVGLIPACAGSTPPWPHCTPQTPAHPRMRGEHPAGNLTSLAVGGSSPHARGALSEYLLRGPISGLIPACAGSTARCRTSGSFPGAHPRMRGEHGLCPIPQVAGDGSSPHARGALSLGPGRRVHVRLIPACAGSTWIWTGGISASGAHPRMRGEHGPGVGCGVHGAGSSPHARGALGRGPGQGPARGLIPACAGSTPGHHHRARCSSAHPRMRGEHQAGTRPTASRGGLSPHARGARLVHTLLLRQPRLIPACAGSTYRSSLTLTGWGAHPRMRGEHGFMAVIVSFAPGSSPHARGARLRAPVRWPGPGLIPACAGSTQSWSPMLWSPPAHPRMRGEHSSLRRSAASSSGSSPHARGAPRDMSNSAPVSRLIPACAGSTSWASRTRMWWAAHPRMRGEHLFPRWLVTFHVGSSPHARGAPGLHCAEGRRVGLIPACAGSTVLERRRGQSAAAHPRMRGEHHAPRVDPVHGAGSSPHARGARTGVRS